MHFVMRSQQCRDKGAANKHIQLNQAGKGLDRARLDVDFHGTKGEPFNHTVYIHSLFNVYSAYVVLR